MNKVFKSLLKEKILSLTETQNEEKNLLKFISSLQLPANAKILDVGCGYGDKMKLLEANGFNVTGVEKNEFIVKKNLELGLNCMSLGQFELTNNKYDVVLMSHIIEHFHPYELLEFMDYYLERLKNGGYLIIATPLYTKSFHDDFDHIRPYHPIGMSMVFGGQRAQVQYYSKNKLEIKDIWFRRSPFKLKFFRGLYVKKYGRLARIFNILLAAIFRFSFGLFGKTTGWMGLYKKIGENVN